MIATGEYHIEEDPGGTFNWKRDRRTWLHLTVFVWVSILVHGSGFYLFKVVYPSPARMETNSGAITLLNPTDPGARAILQRIEDRTVFLLPPSSRAEVRVSLEEGDVRFIPAFNSTELELEPIPETDVVWEKIDDLTLLSAAPNRVELELDPSLLERVVAPWSTIEDYFAMAEAFPTFRARVNILADGKIEVTEIESELDVAEKAGLSEVIASTLRFLPANSTDQGWIEVRNSGD